MKPSLLLLAGIFLYTFTQAQFKGFITEQVDNEGKVPGQTWRVYAEMTHAGDQLFVVFGDSLHAIEIKSSSPFYQSSMGGAMAKEINRKDAADNPKLRYDSWITIGAEDNYNNNVNTLNLDFTTFENGGALTSGKEGAWFCLPTEKQAYCGEDKRILIMQLTTEGRISGKLSLMGKSKDGDSYTKYDQRFECGKK